jgi:hypothetical protein
MYVFKNLAALPALAPSPQQVPSAAKNRQAISSASLHF